MKTTATIASPSVPVGDAGRSDRRVMRRLRTLLVRWCDRRLQRIDLAAADETMLRDLGLTREDVRRECGKSFWRE